MKQRICKRVLASVVLTAMLLTFSGCELRDLLNFNFGGKETVATAPTQAQAVATMPPETQATLPAATDPSETVPPVTEPQEEIYWVRAEGGLNVRSGPGQNYEMVGRLDNGTRVYPEKWENGWAYIVSPVVGWCSGDYLYKERPDYTSDGSYRWIHGDGAVQLYEGPGTEYREIGQLDPGVMVYPLRWEGQWAYIEINDYYTGWCRDNYLSTHDPFPDEQPNEFLSYRAPSSRSLVGKWMVVSNYTEYSAGDIVCRAGVIELKADGTFSHDVYEYMKGYDRGKTIWYCPGGETSGVDCPYWVGEYTFDGKNLVLTYRGEHVNEYFYDASGFPMPVDSHWDRFEKKVTLKVTLTEEGFSVDAPWNIPVHTYNAQGDGSTVSMLYRGDAGMDAFSIPSKLLPIYYP